MNLYSSNRLKARKPPQVYLGLVGDSRSLPFVIVVHLSEFQNTWLNSNPTRLDPSHLDIRTPCLDLQDVS